MTDTTNMDGGGFEVQALLAEASWVRDLAARLCGDADMAGDVAQGALVLAMEKQPVTRGGLRPWLSRVVSTLAQHERRGRGRRRHYEHEVQRTKPEGSPGADELVLRVEAQQRIASAVCGLPQPYRDVLLRRYYDGQSFEAIAEAQGQAASTVRSQVTRGIAKLRAEFEDSDRIGGSAPAIFALAAGSADGYAAGLAGPAAKPDAGSTGRALSRGASRTPNWIPWVLATAAACAIAIPLFVAPSEDKPGLMPVAAPQEVTAIQTPELVGTAEPSQDARADVAAAASAPLVLASAPDQSGRGARVLIVDKGGQPIPGSRLVWAPGGGEPAIIALADDRGIAQLVFDRQPFARELARGWHVPLLAQAPGFAEQTIEWQPEADHLTAIGRVELVPGCTLTGLVLDAVGQPIAGAVVVSATESEAQKGLVRPRLGPAPHQRRVRTKSDAGGRFTLDGLKPGTHRVWLRSNTSLWRLSEPREVAAGSLGDLGSVALEEAGAEHLVTGLVTQGGVPVAGAVVSYAAFTQNLDARTFTGPDGTFRYALPTAQRVALIAWSADSLGAASHCRAAGGGESVALEMEATHRVEVTVIDGAGRPMRNAAILPELADRGVLKPLGGGTQSLPGAQGARTDARGVAELILPVGKIELLAIREGYEPSERFQTDIPGPTSVVLRMARSSGDGTDLKDDPDGAARWGDPRPPVKIEGVFRIDNEPVAGWKMDLRARHGGFDPQVRGMPAKLSETGQFQGACLAGAYLLVAQGKIQGLDVRVVRELNLRGGTKRWTGSLPMGLLDLVVPEPLGECRLVSGTATSGSEVLLGEVLKGRLRIKAPWGMHTLQARGPDGNWRFVRVVDVLPTDR